MKTNLPVTNQIKPNGLTKQPRSYGYTIKTAKLDLKQFVQANLNKKNPHFRVFESESNLFEYKFLNPDNQDPIFAGYGYNLHVIFIYVWKG